MTPIIVDNNQYLFVTEVGSRMWGMEHFASDYDLVHVYQQPSKEYLISGTFEKSRPSKMYIDVNNREIDSQFMEIGHLVNLLKKGNVNAIWAVCSEVIHKNSEELIKLKQITLSNLSKETYQSIKGMAYSQYSDAEKRKSVRDPQKSLWTCMRTLNFGCKLLKEGCIDFRVNKSKHSEPITADECDAMFTNLDIEFENSTLPKYPDSKPFNEYIYKLRLDEIRA